MIQGSIHPGESPVPTLQTPAPTARNSSQSVFVPVDYVKHLNSQDNIRVSEQYGNISGQQTNQTLRFAQRNENVTRNTNLGQLQDQNANTVTGNR